jgi:hypothetical protein
LATKDPLVKAAESIPMVPINEIDLPFNKAKSTGLLVYKASYRGLPLKILFDTGAQRTMFNSKFTKLHNLKIYKSEIARAKLANGYNVPIKGEVKPIQVTINTLKTAIGGLVMDNTSHEIVAGIDWFSRNNPSICWKTKVMTVNRNGVNHKITQDVIDKVLQDTIFCQIINTDNSDEIKDDTELSFIKYSKITDKSQAPQTEDDNLNQVLTKYD